MKICPECGKYGLEYDSYFQRLVCYNRECGASELSSEKIREIAYKDAVKGKCNVCGGNIIKHRRPNSVLHCEKCGIVYYKIPEE